MTETISRLGILTGVILTGCLAAQAGCAPTPVTRTVSTEQVTTTALPPPPPPQVITTTTEKVLPAEHFTSGRSVAIGHRRAAPQDYDVDEETTETIVPVVPVPQHTVTRTTSTRSITGN